MGVNKRNDLEDVSPNRDEKSIRPLLDNSGTKSPNETSIALETFSGNQEPVKDKYYIIYLIFLLFGFACLLPWNLFITAEDYFKKYKLNATENETRAYVNDFTFYTGNIGQTTNVIINLVNIFLPIAGNPKNRIPYTIMSCAAVVVLHIVLAIIDSSTWPFAFFIITCVSVLFMFTSTGIMSSCVFYVSSIFPPEYINAIVLGNNIAGIFTAVISIVSKEVTENYRLAGIFYFTAAFIALMITFIAYFLMHNIQYYQYRHKLAEENKRNISIQSEIEQNAPVPYIKIFKASGFYLFCIWLNFFSMLAIFPVFNLKTARSSDTFIINEKRFQDVVTFLTFNIFVIIGNMLPKVFRLPGKIVTVLVIVRAVLVFVFFPLCNFLPKNRNHIPVLIKNDYLYWAGCAISPLTFGYFTSLLMMYTPRLMPEYAGKISMFAGLTIAFGVATGLQFSKVLEIITLL